jgi:hypothetical protein
MLDDLRATPLASPYAAPYPGAGTLSRSYGASWGLESSADGASTDEPLWVLPEQFIPKAPVGVPGARMTRDRGYLDTPDTIAGISREPLERDSGQLEAGLGWDYCGPRPASVPAQPRPQSGTGAIDLDAGGVSYRQDTQIIHAIGGVKLARGEQRVEADSISYNRVSGDVSPTARPIWNIRGCGSPAAARRSIWSATAAESTTPTTA